MDRCSPGSTISGIFDSNLKTPDPFQFIYISHPFGASSLTPSITSDFYESSFEIMELSNSEPICQSKQNKKPPLMNFHCNFMNDHYPKCYPNIPDTCHKSNKEIYDMKTTFFPPPSNFNQNLYQHHQHEMYPHHSSENIIQCDNNPRYYNKSKSYLQRHILSEEDLGPKIPTPIRKNPPLHNCYDERNVPELKFIFETLRNVWKTPVPLKNQRENKCRKFCCQNLPHKRNGYLNCNIRSGMNISPNSRSNLIRRFSLPEIEIRKYGIIEELDSILRLSDKIRQQNIQCKYYQRVGLQSRFNKIKTFEKSSQTIPVTISENFHTLSKESYQPNSNVIRPPLLQLSDTGPSYLDLVNNRRDVHVEVIKKPETLPEKKIDILKNKDNIEISNPINKHHITTKNKPHVIAKEILKIDEKKSSTDIEPKSVSHTKDNNNKRQSFVSKPITEKTADKKSQNSDNFISELLIKNLNEDIKIADTLMKVLNETPNDRITVIKSTIKTPKIEVSSVYVSAEKINEIVSRNSSIENQSEQVFKQTLQLPDICLLNSFEKLPPLSKFNDALKNESLNSKSCETGKTSTAATIASTAKTSAERSQINISEISSITLQDTFDTPTFPKSIDTTPIDSLDLDSRKSDKINSSQIMTNKNSSKFNTKREFSKKSTNVAEIQPIKTDKNESNGNKISTKSSSQKQSGSLSDKQVVLPQRKKLSRPKINDKGIIDSLEQYTIDSKGNPNYQNLSQVNKTQSKCRYINPQSSAINSRYLRVSASSTTSRHSTQHHNDKLKKVTIFEAQSNIITPDNDMGPKRFYQKTEIFDGDKKIDILEIVECLQSPFHAGVEGKTPGDLYTKLSKIPIPIKKCCQSQNFKCCPIKPQAHLKSIKSIGEISNDDIFFKDCILSHEPFNTCSNHPMKSYFNKVNDLTPNPNEKSDKSNSIEKYKESGVSELNTLDSNTKSSTTNINDGTSTTNNAYTISVPSTMSVNHGSTTTPRKKTSTKYHKTHPMKTSSKSSHASSILQCKSRKLKNSGKYEKLLSHRKQHHQHEIINVKPAKYPNQSIESSCFKKESAQASFNLNDEKLNAWRIPSCDFYNQLKHPSQPQPPPIIDNKTIICDDHKFLLKSNDCNTIKFPRTCTESKLKDKCTPSSKCATDSILSTTTICEKCRLCSCYTSTTFSDRLLYSPTLSICSVCSQPFTPLYRSSETPSGVDDSGRIGECFGINCRQNSTTLKKECNFNLGDLNYKNKMNLPPTSSQRVENSCSRDNNNCNCFANRFPKLISNDCTGGLIQQNNNTSTFCKINDPPPFDRFLTSGSSFASSIWKSTRSHTAMPCVNWKAVLDNKKKPEVKIEPVKLTASEDKKGNGSVFTVTVKGPNLEKGTDLKMELCFSNPNKDNMKNLNDVDNETDEISSCSVETIHEKMLPEGSSKDLCNTRKVKMALDNPIHSIDPNDSEYHINLSSILNQRNPLNNINNSSGGNNNLSVSGNAIAPEQKPKAPTMTEKDLTGRYRK